MAFDPTSAKPFDPSSAAPAGGSSFDPGSAAPVDTNDQAPLRGADAVPGSNADKTRRGVPLAPASAPQAPLGAPSAGDRVTGVIEAGLNLAAGIMGSTYGMVAGMARATGENLGVLAPSRDLAAEASQRAGILSGGVVHPTPQPAATPDLVPTNLETAQNQESQQATQTIKDLLPSAQTLAAGPMGLARAGARQIAKLAGHKVADDTPSPQAQEVAENLQDKYIAPAADTLVGAAGALHTVGVPGAVDAAKQGAPVIAKAVGNAAGDAVGAAAKKVFPVDPELLKVAQTASELKYPIDVRPDQVVDNAKFTKLAGQASSDIPLSNSKNASNQEAFTKNVISLLNPADEKSTRLTPDVFSDAMDRSGKGIGDITERTPVPAEDIKPGLESIKDDIATATDENQRIVNTYIGQLADRVGENGQIDGTALKELNSKIGAQARTNAGNDLGRYLSNLQDVIQDGVERSAAPADVQPLRDFRRQYAYGKMLEPEVAKTIDGKVSPAGLMSAVTRTKQGKYYMARQMGGPIGDLAKVGQLIKEPKSSGTAERALVYGKLGLGGSAALAEPHAAAAAYGSALAYNTLGPKLVRRMIAKRELPRDEPPPAEPTTSPGAAPEGGGGGAAPPAGPLGDLTPEWETSPGAGGGVPRGGHEPGLNRAVDEPPHAREPGLSLVDRGDQGRPGLQIPGVDLVDEPELAGSHERMWSTSPGAGGEGTARETGLHRAHGEAEPSTGNRKARLEQETVPGRPDLPDTMVAGNPAEIAASDRANEEMHSPGAIEARRQQAGEGPEAPPNQEGGGKGGGEPPEGSGGPPIGPSAEEAQRLLDENPPEAVKAVLRQHLKDTAAGEAKRVKGLEDEATAAQLERTARTTTDPGLQKRLLAQADKLRGTEKIPVGEVREGQPSIKTSTEKIPVGKVIEGQPEIKTTTPGKIPTGEATEITPEKITPPDVPDIPTGEATELTPDMIEADHTWRQKFGLGEQDAVRARDVARALGHDERAVERAAVQHENSPRAFDREIERINDEGNARANEAKRAAEGSEGDAGAAGTRGGRDGGDAARTGSGQAAGDESARAVRTAADESGANGADATRGQHGGRAEPGQGQLEIREVPGGFEAHKGGKKIGYLKDNLERGQAKQFDENANVNMVKVDKDQVGTGVGRALYKAFEDKHEGRIMPSGKTEPSAWKLWKRNYPDKVEAFVKQEAARIRDGADTGIVARNITDPEVRSRVLKEAERGTDTKPDNQPSGLRKKDGGKSGPQADDPEEVFKSSGSNEGQKATTDHPQGKPVTPKGWTSVEGDPARAPVGSPEKMDDVLRAKFGNKLIDGLKREGILKYALSADEGMFGDKRGVKAVYRGMQRRPAATLYVDRMTADQAPGILMHELGEHFGVIRMLGQERYGVMLNELKAMKDEPEVKDAWAKVKHNYVGEGTASKLAEGDDRFLREVAAHLVENHPDLPFVRRLINEIRAFFYENFGTTMGNTVDANLVRGLAASALRRASKGDLPKMKQPVPIRPMFAKRAQPGAAAP